MAVRITTSGPRALVRVENEGKPIAVDPEVIFQPFASYRPQGTQRADNLGLGLYVARQIARAHGGDVKVVPPAELDGAAFEVGLPLL